MLSDGCDCRVAAARPRGRSGVRCGGVALAGKPAGYNGTKATGVACFRDVLSVRMRTSPPHERRVMRVDAAASSPHPRAEYAACRGAMNRIRNSPNAELLRFRTPPMVLRPRTSLRCATMVRQQPAQADFMPS
jgi:hypothetical protein